MKYWLAYLCLCIHQEYIFTASEYDTWIFPTIEIPPCDIHIDSTAVGEVLAKVPNNSDVHLASGYFNLNEKYVSAILKSNAKYDVLVAHPTVSVSCKYSRVRNYLT